jgi:hypothetical protein
MKATFVRKVLVLAALGTVTATSIALSPPEVDIDPYRHGNLAAAQQMIRQAFDRVSDAQEANNYRLGGHAARAKELLSQASEEIKMAAIAANQR